MSGKKEPVDLMTALEQSVKDAKADRLAREAGERNPYKDAIVELWLQLASPIEMNDASSYYVMDMMTGWPDEESAAKGLAADIIKAVLEGRMTTVLEVES